MHIRLRHSRALTDETRGQALVEFALILVPALLILMGIIQFGFLFSGQIGIINGVRETARFGSTSPVNDAAAGATNGANVCTYLKDTALPRVAGYSSSNLVTGGATFVRFTSYPDPHPGTPTYSVRLTVHVEYRHQLLIPLVGAIIDGLDGVTDSRFRLGAEEAMRVENPIITTDPNLDTTVSC